MPGETYGLVGESGSGKQLLVEVLFVYINQLLDQLFSTEKKLVEN